MNQIGTDIRTYFEATTEPVKIEEIFDPGVVIVGPGGSRSERDDTMLTQERPAQTSPSRFRGPRIAAVAAITALIVAIGVFALGGGNDDPQVVTTDPQVTVPPTSVAPTTVPPTTAPSTTAPTNETTLESDPATKAIDQLLAVYNSEDAPGIEAYFDDAVAYNNPSGEELIGSEASDFWLSYFGRDTGERLTEAYTTAEGMTMFLLRFTTPDGRESTQTFEVEMDGDRLIRIDDRGQRFDEVLATNAVDELLRAFTDQNVDALSAIFGDDVVYTSPANVDFVGSQAVDRWQGAFGEIAERTTGVFGLGDGTYGFNVDWIEPDSGRANKGTVTLEMIGGKITGWTDAWRRG